MNVVQALKAALASEGPTAGARPYTVRAMETVDAVVVGAGVVGLAVARALARCGLETVVVEREATIGSGCSSRNSEVIHAGLYYPDGSWKARLCVSGRQRLYAHCAAHGVAHRRCGKWLVATDDSQRGRLQDIAAQARRNGVDDLQWLQADELRMRAPALHAVAALSSPSTGIVDSHALMLSLQADAERHGAVLALRAPLLASQRHGAVHLLELGGAAPMRLAAAHVVNAAGLWAPEVARGVAELPAALRPVARFVKGNYFSLSGRAPFDRLIYPMPSEAGLGVHLTLDLAGRARFGPDVEWLSAVSPHDLDYRVDAQRLGAFEDAVRRYWPGLPAGSLQPDYSGVRPKVQWGLSAGTEPVQDFVIQGPAEHGLAGWVNLYGIESPGLTACLALADEVLSRLSLAEPVSATGR